MTPLEGLEQIEKEAKKIAHNQAKALYKDLIHTAPVYQYTGNVPSKQRQGGHFKKSYSIMKITTWHTKIINTASYADVLARGRRIVGGRFYGSIQWRNGLAPMLKKTNAIMQVQFARLKA